MKRVSMIIHMMTSQGRIHVLCVTNGLQWSWVWHVTERDTLEKTCIHVLSVRNVFHLRPSCISIWIFIEVNTSAQNVANVVIVVMTWQDTEEVIQERNRLNVLFVANDFQMLDTLVDTIEFTVERNHSNVMRVTRRLVGLKFLTVTWESTLETNLTRPKSLVSKPRHQHARTRRGVPRPTMALRSRAVPRPDISSNTCASRTKPCSNIMSKWLCSTTSEVCILVRIFVIIWIHTGRSHSNCLLNMLLLLLEYSRRWVLSFSVLITV